MVTTAAATSRPSAPHKHLTQAQDPALSALWHRRAAEAGHPQGMLALSRHLARGRSTPRDPAQAVRWVAAAAEAGLPEAQAELGRRLLRGDGVSADAKSAAYWLRKCASPWRCVPCAGGLVISDPVCDWRVPAAGRSAPQSSCREPCAPASVTTPPPVLYAGRRTRLTRTP